MKTKILVLVLIFSLGYQFSFGQENTTNSFQADDLIGVWYPTYVPRNNNLVFHKKKVKPRRYGTTIEILKDGKFISRYSAPCGNDRNWRTRNYNGQWSLDETNWTITSTKPIYQRGSVYQIVELNADTLVLVEVKVE